MVSMPSLACSKPWRESSVPTRGAGPGVEVQVLEDDHRDVVAGEVDQLEDLAVVALGVDLHHVDAVQAVATDQRVEGDARDVGGDEPGLEVLDEVGVAEHHVAVEGPEGVVPAPDAVAGRGLGQVVERAAPVDVGHGHVLEDDARVGVVAGGEALEDVRDRLHHDPPPARAQDGLAERVELGAVVGADLHEGGVGHRLGEGRHHLLERAGRPVATDPGAHGAGPLGPREDPAGESRPSPPGPLDAVARRLPRPAGGRQQASVGAHP
jgi:hypothetical protein